MTPPALLLAVLAAMTLAGAGCGRGYDPYDDGLRGTNPGGSSRLVFGQAIGPDGDGCWPENDRDYSGRVFCDLVSIGGLHWDAGEVRVAASADILMGSGFMCLLDEDGVPWCWEWNQEVQPPRPARVPQDVLFGRLNGGSSFACAQTPDEVKVTCWTVGIDQPRFRQATHRISDGSQWVMMRVLDDPQRFTLDERGSGRGAHFHPFTGEKLSGGSTGTRLLVTETAP